MKKNTKAMLTLLAATSITSVAGITSYANTKYIDTNVSAKQFNDAIEAKIKEEAERAAAEANAPAVEDTLEDATEFSAAADEVVEAPQANEPVEAVTPEAPQADEPVETVVLEAEAPQAENTESAAITIVPEAELSSETELASGTESAAEAVSASDLEKLNEEIEDVLVAEDSEAVVSSGFIISRNAKVIDTTAVASVTGNTSLAGAVAKAVANKTTSGTDLVDGPDNTPAETYAAPIFSTGKLIISGSSNQSIITEPGNVTSKTSDIDTDDQRSAEEGKEEEAEVVSETNEQLRTRVAAYAASFANGVGKYRYGGTNPYTGADCSGFVQHVLAKTAGIGISRTSASQATQGERVGSIDQAKPGDLLFYAKGGRVNHVGMYLGNGKVISASSPSTGMRITAYNYRPVVGIRNVLGN